MAKTCAELPEDDEELQKKLWLKIARHVVQEEKDVKKAMNCLSSCNLLKIEDILPFFPDFVTIDHFKVCSCLISKYVPQESHPTFFDSIHKILLTKASFLRRRSVAPWRSTISTLMS